jgi:ketosteroid isomerase-like protein
MLLLAGFVICAMGRAQSVQAAGQAVPASTVEQALSRFLVAFDNLDWPAFRVCFAKDATMFHPASPNIKRIDSPEAFEKAWLGVFARIKKESGRDQPPYMDLRPQNLLIQMLSPDIALATFHLIDGDTVDRRSIVLKQYPDGWKIVHIHASNIGSTTR